MPPSAEFLEDHEHVRKRWPPWLREVFAAEAPRAVWIGGSRDSHVVEVRTRNGGMPARFGGNLGCRPVVVGTSGAWHDTVTQRLDHSPYHWQGLLGRVWVERAGHEQALMAAAADDLRSISTGVVLRKGWIDVGPDFLEPPTAYLMRIAHENIIAAWDDIGLVERLLRIHRRKRAREQSTVFEKG